MRDSGAQRGAYAPVVDTYEPVAAAPHTTALGRFMAHMALMYRGLVFGLTWHAALMVSVTCFCTFLCSQKMFDIKFNTSMQVLQKTTLPTVRSQISFAQERSLFLLYSVSFDTSACLRSSRPARCSLSSSPCRPAFRGATPPSATWQK